MTEITLVLPYALPPPEMAKDLLRALKTPSLAALTSRHSGAQHDIFNNNDSRVLPHEAWLAHALGLGPAPTDPVANAPIATTAMRGCGLHAEAASGYWFILQPAHIQLSRTHLLLSDPRGLHLSEAESRTLYDIARPYFEELGKTLLYAAPDLWFVRADDWSGLRTTSPDAAATQNLSDWMPEGERARDYRKLQNEIQMLWHEHPVNEARQSRGLQAVNSLWLWGGAGAGAMPAIAAIPAIPATPATPATASAPAIAIVGGPSWMEALAGAELRQASAAQLLARPAETTVVLAELIPSAQTGDWSDWLARLQRLETEWFAPLQAALQAGRVKRVTLVLSHRNGWTTIRTSKLAQRKFWRPQNLNTLLHQA